MGYWLRVLLVWGVAVSAWAEQVVDLYQVETLVTSQRQSERQQAAADGLAEIIVRVSGSASALKSEEVKKALTKAQSYIYEFRYASTDEKLVVDKREVPATRLIFKFSPQAVEKLLRRASLPMWSANRRSLLVWLVVDDVRSGRQLVSKADDPEPFKVLTDAAQQRGLPMVMPLFDLQDRVSLSADSAWSLNEDEIREASERYQADIILLGRYSRTSRGEWRATWLLLQKSVPGGVNSGLRQQMRSKVFDSFGFELDTVIADGVHQVADYLAGLYAIVPSEDAQDMVVMQLGGINSFGNYIDALNYLDRIAMVRHVHLGSVNRDSMLVDLYIDGELSLLVDAFALDKKLQPVVSLGGVPTISQWRGPRGSALNPLQYQWPTR